MNKKYKLIETRDRLERYYAVLNDENLFPVMALIPDEYKNKAEYDLEVHCNGLEFFSDELRHDLVTLRRKYARWIHFRLNEIKKQIQCYEDNAY